MFEWLNKIKWDFQHFKFQQTISSHLLGQDKENKYSLTLILKCQF